MNDKKYEEYLKNARYCREMAEWVAASSKLRADWLRLADKWMSMVPGGGRHLNSGIAADTAAREESRGLRSTRTGVPMSLA